MPFGIGEASGLGGLASGLWGLFGGGGKNPSDAAMPYLDKIPSWAREMYQPYINQGQGMMGGMGDIYKQMMENPTEFFNKIGSGYKESPGYQNSLKEAMGSIGNSAAAGGMAGSAMHQQLSGEKASDLASKDFQQYLDNVLGINRTGLQGGENTVNRGFNASQGLFGALGNNAAQQAGLAYKGTDWENRENNNNWSNIFGGASMLMPWMFQ